MCAALEGRADCARLLLDAGADKHAEDDVRICRSFYANIVFMC